MEEACPNLLTEKSHQERIQKRRERVKGRRIWQKETSSSGVVIIHFISFGLAKLPELQGWEN